MSDKPLILVADDEDDVRELVCLNLHQAGYRTVEAGDGIAALSLARERKPATMVLDIMMPGRDGYRVCELLRQDEVTKSIPVIMLTARGQTQDRIEGLQKGADDYLAKPFSPKELVLRIHALVRRSAATGSASRLKVGPFDFDLASVKLTIDGVPLPLTLLEFKLLHLLASKHGDVVDRDTILREVWGYSEQARTRTLDTHMKRLREKLGAHAGWLQTSRGYGYVFKPSAVK